MYFPRGQCARLIRTKNIHAAKILDGDQPFYNNLLRGHVPCPVSQIDAYDGGQQKWGNADGQGQLKK